MNRWLHSFGAACVCVLIAGTARTESTIDPAHPHAYGGNIGWLTAPTNATSGLSIGEWYVSGWMHGANIGWVHLGNGAPANGYRHANTSEADFGVNHVGCGALRGYAWSGNVGWIVFAEEGNPRVDLRTGVLSGYAWGANIGWIGFSNAQAHVRTIRLDTGADSEPDGLPDAWEWLHTNSLQALSADADWDQDGVNDGDEYIADTDPLDARDRLRIVSAATTDGVDRLEWTCRATRLYRVDATNALMPAASGGWPDAGPGLMGPGAAPTMAVDIRNNGAEQRFYRVRALLPQFQ